MKRNGMLVAVVLLAVGSLGCGGEEGDALLLHPISGDVIGYVVAGDYHLGDRVIWRGTIERITVEPRLAQPQSSSPAAVPVRPLGDLCWRTHQGGLWCDGCCQGSSCLERCSRAPLEDGQ